MSKTQKDRLMGWSLALAMSLTLVATALLLVDPGKSVMASGVGGGCIAASSNGVNGQCIEDDCTPEDQDCDTGNVKNECSAGDAIDVTVSGDSSVCITCLASLSADRVDRDKEVEKREDGKKGDGASCPCTAQGTWTATGTVNTPQDTLTGSTSWAVTTGQGTLTSSSGPSTSYRAPSSAETATIKATVSKNADVDLAVDNCLPGGSGDDAQDGVDTYQISVVNPLASTTVSVSGNPAANAACVGSNVSFVVSASINNGPSGSYPCTITGPDWHWTKTSSSGSNWGLVPTSIGASTADLTLTDPSDDVAATHAVSVTAKATYSIVTGSSVSVSGSKDFSVDIAKVASLSVSENLVGVGETATFTAVSQPVGNESLLEWSGDGVTGSATGAQLQLSWSEPGDKTVHVGCSTFDQDLDESVTVVGAASVDGPDVVCSGCDALFIGQSDPTGHEDDLEWNSSGMPPYEMASTYVAFFTTGLHDVTLTYGSQDPGVTHQVAAVEVSLAFSSPFITQNSQCGSSDTSNDITIATNPAGYESSVILEMEEVGGYTDEGSLQQISSTAWRYTAPDEPSGLGAKAFTVIIKALVDDQECTQGSFLVKSPFQYLQIQIPATNATSDDYMAVYNYIDCKYGTLPCIQAIGANFGDVSVSSDDYTYCGLWPGGEYVDACTNTATGNVEFGQLFLATSSESDVLSTMGHELIHAGGNGSECDAYTWEIDNAACTGLSQQGINTAQQGVNDNCP